MPAASHRRSRARAPPTDSRYGFDGWLPTDLADPGLVIQDKQLLTVILSAAQDTLADFIGRPLLRP
ncbi:hypothetical protein [Streptomyces sp. NPDC060035]|uniref:hypothetical protein n=1 Tax=Streptomyces sp. NPDC060035 TaxID=3347044 RepID=UPI0036BD94C5